MGVELMLSPGAVPRVERPIVDIGYAGEGLVHEKAAHALYEVGRKLGVRMVFATSDMGGLKNASPEEAEQILANAAIKIRLGRDGSVFEANARALLAAGYIKGQTYEQCLEMAKWHPAMHAFMKLMGEDGSDSQKQQFGYAWAHLQDEKRTANWQSDLHHEVVSGKSRDGMKDALSSFASDLHEVFRKHEMLVTVGRAEGVQLAVSRKLLDLLGQHEGAEGYLGNLHII
ncbi:MAG: hypothetical protein ACYCPA_08505 [Acidithiobacillus sp.]